MVAVRGCGEDVAATVEQFRAIGDSVGIPQANSRGEIAEIEAFEKGSKPTTG